MKPSVPAGKTSPLTDDTHRSDPPSTEPVSDHDSPSSITPVQDPSSQKEQGQEADREMEQELKSSQTPSPSRLKDAISSGSHRSTRPHFKVQNRPAQLIRNLHANYFNRSMADRTREAPTTSAVGKTVQGIRGHIFAFGAAVSLTGCALLLGGHHDQPWMHSQVVYHGLFAAACSWQWLRRMSLSLPINDLRHADPITDDDAQDEQPSEPRHVASSLPYWILGYGLLGVLGSTSTVAHGLTSHLGPVSLLAACSPVLVGSVLLGLERISHALFLDQHQHAAEKEALQDEHEFMMEAYREENLYRKNVLLETVGKEVQDAATLAIETLRQMTPTNLFPPNVSHEQLSPCTLPIPITSVLGLFTTMLHLQYISRNMERLSRVMFTEYVQGIVEKTSPHYHKGENSFDVGEFVQSLGDLVSADASLKGVEFVIYHAEYDMNHVSIKGSEESWRHALINVSGF